MKQLILLLATAAIVSCNYKGADSAYRQPVHAWHEEETNGQTVRTEFEWAYTGGMIRQVGETKTEFGFPIYEDTEYKYEGQKITFLRTNYTPFPSTETHELVYKTATVQASYEVTRTGEADPYQWMKREFDSANRITREEEMDGDVHTLKTGYLYSEDGSGGAIVEYDELIERGDETTTRKVTATYADSERKMIRMRQTHVAQKLVELEWWYYNGSQTTRYERYVGENITVTGSQLSGATMAEKWDEYTYQGNSNVEVISYTKSFFGTDGRTVISQTEIRDAFELREFDI